MIHDRLRVAELFELVPGHVVERIMYRLALQVLELWHPVSDVVALRVAFLRLRQGVEDSLQVSLAL